MSQSISSKSYLMNSAAKDDVLQTDLDNNYSIGGALLANDPGSAKFYAFNTAGVVNNGDGTFSITDKYLTGFDYTEQMANGTFSKAHVNLVTHEDDVNLIHNGAFDQDGATPPWHGFSSIDTWINLNGQTLEEVLSGYQGITFPAPVALDTQASPGGIDISQSIDIHTGTKATLAFDISAQQFLSYMTDPNEHLVVTDNGHVVADITQASLGDYNTFHHESVQLTGVAGADVIEFHSTGASANVGMLLTNISVHEWVV